LEPERHDLEGHPVPCPKCGASITEQSAWTKWCASCDWNVVPPSVVEQSQTARNLRAAAAGQRSFDRVREVDLSARRRSASTYLTFAVSLLIHLGTAAVMVAGIVIIILTWPIPVYVFVGLLVLVLGFVLRPRVSQLPHGIVLRQDEMPGLHQVIARLADGIGAPGYEVIVITGDFNTSTSSAGWRRTRVLAFGAPLWNLMSAEERYAVIAHELAHQVNDDVRRGAIVATALNTLAVWHRVLLPGPRAPLVGWIRIFQIPYLVLVRWPAITTVRLLVRLLLRLSSPDHLRAEYLADALAARCVGTTALLGALDAMLLIPMSEDHLSHAFTSKAHEDPWELQRRLLAVVPEQERERLRRADIWSIESPHDSHPPNHRRIALLRHRHPEAGLVTITASDAARADVELSDLLSHIGATTRRNIRASLTPAELEALGY
jgi:Zn-dependent protease with chaperone function